MHERGDEGSSARRRRTPVHRREGDRGRGVNRRGRTVHRAQRRPRGDPALRRRATGRRKGCRPATVERVARAACRRSGMRTAAGRALTALRDTAAICQPASGPLRTTP
jgi:hypothetical protein